MTLGACGYHVLYAIFSSLLLILLTERKGNASSQFTATQRSYQPSSPEPRKGIFFFNRAKLGRGFLQTTRRPERPSMACHVNNELSGVSENSHYPRQQRGIWISERNCLVGQ